MATIAERATAVEPRLFTVAEYGAMIERGILREGERVELLGGVIVRMAAMGARHAESLTRTTELVTPPLVGVARVRVQMPVVIPEYDEPEPDVAVVRPRDYGPGPGHPTPADILLLVEVSDTSLGFDRREKLPVYARAGIPESWLVDLPGDGIERHADPDPERGLYRSVTRFGRGEMITSVVLPRLAFPVDAVLGRPPAEGTPAAS